MIEISKENSKFSNFCVNCTKHTNDLVSVKINMLEFDLCKECAAELKKSLAGQLKEKK